MKNEKQYNNLQLILNNIMNRDIDIFTLLN